MRCPAITYYPGEEGLEKSTVVFLGGQEKKEVPRKICDNYYPFGLTFNSFQRSIGKENKYLFGGKEIQNDLDLGWLDFHARQYDPVIGRMLSGQ